MAPGTRKILHICRFCLCQDEVQLRPIEKLPQLIIQDIERFTGIKINTKENISYAICLDCTQTLKTSADFRQSCLNNNAQFQKLLRQVNASAKSVPIGTVRALAHQETDPLNLHFVIKDDDDDEAEEIEEDIIEIYDEDDEDVNDTNSQRHKASNDQSEDYCANYIDIGECTESDEYEPDYVHSGVSNNSLSKTLEVKPRGSSKSTETNSRNEVTEVRTVVTKRTRKSFNRQYLCYLCGKQVTNIGCHMQSHESDRKYACPHCPWKMTDKHNLAQHIKNVHLKLITKTCSICSKGFINNKSLLRHMNSCHGIGERIPCSMCPRMFTEKYRLNEHMRSIHSNVRSVTCNICGMAFKLSHSLKTHMRVHSTDQPYPCSKCPKRFKSSYARRIHELTHSGIVFECTHCGKSYRYKSLLNMHIRKTHSEKCELTEAEESFGQSVDVEEASE